MEEDSREGIDILRRLKPKDRLKAAFELYEFARRRIVADLRQRYPNLTEEELMREVKKRFS